jgi:REP element-mobilizing transposase RayT
MHHAPLDLLQVIFGQRCKDWGGELMEFNGEADHVHALPNLDLSRFGNNVKTTCSRLVRREFAHQLNAIYRKPRILVAIVLHHFVRRCDAVGAQAIRRAAGVRRSDVRARARSRLHPHPGCTPGWSTGGNLVAT